MQYVYKTLAYTKENLSTLPVLGTDGWKLVTIYDEKIFLLKEQKQQRNSKELDLNGFESWYKLYPRKVLRGSAEKAWNKLSENQRILAMEGIKKYIIYWKKKGTQKEFMPHPATWLDVNDQRWNDDLSEVPETAIVQTNEKAKEEDEENRRNEQEKKELDAKIVRLSQDPQKWKEIEKQALSELTESQRQSPMKDALLKIRIRMIVSKT